MLLYLMRHAVAALPAPGQEDDTRRLTPEGEETAEKVGRAVARSGLAPERLFCSPYVRARQTAALVGTALGLTAELDALVAPGCSPESLQELYEASGGPERVMVIGHQPDMGRIAYALTGCTIGVREAMLIAIEAPSPGSSRGALRGVYDPDVMATLGGALVSGRVDLQPPQ